MAIGDNEYTQMIKKGGRNLVESARKAIEWFKNKIKQIVSKLSGRLQSSDDDLFTKDATPMVGGMFMYVYDAKYKDKLPFFDMYPLVFPIDFYHDGFLGINLHYLPPLARASLLDRLKSLSNNNRYDDSTRLNISYGILKSSAGAFSGYENCVKRYLFSQVRSSFHQVSPVDWDKAVLLPLQRWHVNPNPRLAGLPPY